MVLFATASVRCYIFSKLKSHMIFPICDLLISSIGIDTVEVNLCLPSVSLKRSGIAEGRICELNPQLQRNNCITYR